MRVLVTGGTGFIGRHAVQSLRAAGHSVVCASRTPLRSVPVDWITSDILLPGEIDRVVHSARADAILHLAWTTEHGKFWTDLANLNWVSATCELAAAALRHGTKRLCITGTCFEYDWPADADCDEIDTPSANHLLYDTSKNSCRQTLTTFSAQHGLSLAWGRLFMLYGPSEHPARLASSVARSIVAGQPAKCSSGIAVRDFMDSRDAGAALAALTVSKVEGVVNIASGEPRSVADVALMLGKISGRPDLIEIGALPDRIGDPPRITAAVNRLRHEVGFSSTISLDDGLKDVLQFWASINNVAARSRA